MISRLQALTSIHPLKEQQRCTLPTLPCDATLTWLQFAPDWREDVHRHLHDKEGQAVDVLVKLNCAESKTFEVVNAVTGRMQRIPSRADMWLYLVSTTLAHVQAVLDTDVKHDETKHVSIAHSVWSVRAEEVDAVSEEVALHLKKAVPRVRTKLAHLFDGTIDIHDAATGKRIARYYRER